MGAGHGHTPSRSAGGQQRGRMLIVLALTSIVLLAELIGSWFSGSLSLLADAGHMFTDVLGISLSILAVTFAARPATEARTFGNYRLEILATVVNATVLLGVAVFIMFEAWQRWLYPSDVRGGLMLAFAGVGLISNIIGLVLLQDGSKVSLNAKGAYLEVLGDTLGSAAVISAAAIISLTGWQRADIVASVLVALMIMPRTWTLLREAVDVLLQAVPKGTDLPAIRQHILDTPGVRDAHDLHVWTLTSGLSVLSVHVVVDDTTFDADAGRTVLLSLRDCLAHHFDVDHCTFQLEPTTLAEQERSIHP